MTQAEKTIAKAAKILDEKYPEFADKKIAGYLIAGQVVFPIKVPYTESDLGLIGGSKPNTYIVNPILKRVKPWRMNPTLASSIGKAIIKNRYLAFDPSVEAEIAAAKADLKDLPDDAE